MSSLEDARRYQHRTHRLDCLTHVRRRRALRYLLDRSVPVSERELAARLATAERERSTESITYDRLQTVQTELRHVHLPKLAEAGVVDWNRTAGTVTVGDHAGLDHEFLFHLAEKDSRAWDGVIECIADDRRRHVLAVLLERDGRMSREELARAVAGKLPEDLSAGDRLDDFRVRLHHLHLPKLADAGLIEYDAEDGTATPDADPEVVELLRSIR